MQSKSPIILQSNCRGDRNILYTSMALKIKIAETTIINKIFNITFSCYIVGRSYSSLVNLSR